MPNDLRLLWRFKRSAAAFSAAAFPGIEQSMMKVVEREKTAPNGDFLAPNTLGAYIQVPFCQSKCTYCNFHTGVVAPDRYQPYAEAVCREIAESAPAGAPVVDTVYVGGGTPSLLDPSALEQILAALRAAYRLEAQEI